MAKNIPFKLILEKAKDYQALGTSRTGTSIRTKVWKLMS